MTTLWMASDGARRGLCLFVASALASQSLGMEPPRIESLGTLPGGLDSTAFAISRDGNWVVGSSGTALESGGYRWGAGVGMQQIAPPPGLSGVGPLGVSANGGAVAGAVFVDGVGVRGFRWTGAGLTTLGSLVANGGSSGNAISDDGMVVVGRADTSDSQRAFRWTEASGMEDLGVLPGTGTSGAMGTNADGSVVAGFSAGFSQTKAFRWTAAGGMQDLGSLVAGGSAMGMAMSSDGDAIAGHAWMQDGNRAFRWTAGGGMENLGTASGWSYSMGTCISGDGLAVAGYGGGEFSGGDRAFYWTESLGMVDLNVYLASVGVDMSGWTLHFAHGLSADGSAITGFGEFEGSIRAWRVSGVPAPGSAVLVGIAGILSRRRRRS